MDRLTVMALFFSSLVSLAPAGGEEPVGARDFASSSYMYIYCNRFPGNSYCANRFTKEGQVKSIIRDGGSNLSGDGLSTLTEGKEYIGKDLPAYVDSSDHASTKDPAKPTESSRGGERAGGDSKAAINSKSHLVKWIKDVHGVELSGTEYSPAELADIYTRLMWCSKIRKELGDECDYQGSSSDELRARYESAKKSKVR